MFYRWVAGLPDIDLCRWRLPATEREAEMKYLAFICSDGVSSAEKSSVMGRECSRWVTEMDGRGVRLLGRELDPPETAVTVKVRDGEILLTDGPFAESKEYVAGFDVLDCADLDEAVDVVAKHPVSWFHSIEIRPFKEGLEVGVEALAFGRRDDARGIPHLLMMCLDGIPGTPEVEEEVVQGSIEWGRDLEERGAMVLGHPLQPKETATTIRVRDGETLISDGPFIETKEFIGGIAVIYTTGRKEAIEIAAAQPLARYHMVEVRPFGVG
jgi:hypothetical protein